jgi:hypothetical protein
MPDFTRGRNAQWLVSCNGLGATTSARWIVTWHTPAGARGRTGSVLDHNRVSILPSWQQNSAARLKTGEWVAELHRERSN